MKKAVHKKKHSHLDEMLPEYDFSKAKRVGNKYFKKLKNGANLVAIDPELKKSFPTSEAVNSALRKFLQIKQTAA
ncbi:MAG: hypothetical protein PHP42_00720 [Bacteroidota bacterium]|nr:hypothetical protein [Bacteroidota bacterium]